MIPKSGIFAERRAAISSNTLKTKGKSKRAVAIARLVVPPAIPPTNAASGQAMKAAGQPPIFRRRKVVNLIEKLAFGKLAFA
jgi:hypothetical protein